MPLACGPAFGPAFGLAVAPADSVLPSGLKATDDKVPGGGGTNAREEKPEGDAAPAAAPGRQGVGGQHQGQGHRQGRHYQDARLR